MAALIVQGDEGFAVVDTNPGGGGYLYGVTLRRTPQGWVDGSDGNGPGWTATDPERELGVRHFWGEAPRGAPTVRIEYGGEVREVPVQNGVYLTAWFGVSPDEG